MAQSRELLTSTQRREYLSVPDNIAEFQLNKYFTLSTDDINIIKQHRGDYNKLGFAMQLCIIRYTGWTLSNIEYISETAICFVASQLNILPMEFNKYAERSNTLYEHADEIMIVYDYNKFTESKSDVLIQLLIEKAQEFNNHLQLISCAINYLKSVKVILPVIKTIEKTVSLAREKVINDSILYIYNLLNDTQKEKLNKILETDFSQKKTKLSWLREIPGKSSSKTFNEIADRIEYIHSLELQNIDLSNIHNNRIEELYKLGSKYEAYDFKRFNAEKRYSILSIYLINFCKKLIDQAIQIHDIQIQSVQSFGKKEQENLMKKNGKKANMSLHNYVELGRAIIKAKEEGKPAVDFKTIEDVMPWDEFVISINEVSEITRPKEYNSLDLITQKYSALRRYTPRLLKILEFKASKTGEPVLKALETIKELNSKTKKKVPKGAPLDFVTKQWEKYVYDQEGNIDKKYYELAAFTELKNAIRSGDISIVGSNAANWRMSDDNMEKAMTDIINCQHKQPYAKYWGDGSTSSSDGVRVKSAVEALNACYNPHYGLEKGVTMYSE